MMLGGGGYNLYNVSRCWAVMISELIGEKLDKEIPDHWRGMYQRIVGKTSPLHLHDKDIPRHSNETGSTSSNESRGQKKASKSCVKLAIGILRKVDRLNSELPWVIT